MPSDEGAWPRTREPSSSVLCRRTEVLCSILIDVEDFGLEQGFEAPLNGHHVCKILPTATAKPPFRLCYGLSFTTLHILPRYTSPIAWQYSEPLVHEFQDDNRN